MFKIPSDLNQETKDAILALIPLGEMMKENTSGQLVEMSDNEKVEAWVREKIADAISINTVRKARHKARASARQAIDSVRRGVNPRLNQGQGQGQGQGQENE